MGDRLPGWQVVFSNNFRPANSVRASQADCLAVATSRLRAQAPQPSAWAVEFLGAVR